MGPPPLQRPQPASCIEFDGEVYWSLSERNNFRTTAAPSAALGNGFGYIPVGSLYVCVIFSCYHSVFDGLLRRIVNQAESVGAIVVRIVSLNIRHGGGKRITRLADWLAGNSPSAVVLPEWRNNATGRYIRERLAEIGLQCETVENSRTTKSNSVLIAAAGMEETRVVTPMGSQNGELLMARIHPGINLIGCYFPGQNAKIPFFMRCIQLAQENAHMPLVIIGDINTGRNDLDVEGKGLPFLCTDRFAALNTEADLIDLWRARHGDEREWTWRSSVNGFRIDHAFGNTAFVNRFPGFRCNIDHAPRLSGLTDHSAVILEAN